MHEFSPPPQNHHTYDNYDIFKPSEISDYSRLTCTCVWFIFTLTMTGIQYKYLVEFYKVCFPKNEKQFHQWLWWKPQVCQTCLIMLTVPLTVCSCHRYSSTAWLIFFSFLSLPLLWKFFLEKQIHEMICHQHSPNMFTMHTIIVNIPIFVSSMSLFCNFLQCHRTRKLENELVVPESFIKRVFHLLQILPSSLF